MGDHRPRSRLRIALHNFSASWFLIPQGTGIIAVILHQLHYQFHGLATISVIFWLINIVLLFIFFLLFLVRFALEPRVVIYGIANDTTEASCLASISVAFTSALQMLSLVVVPSWGGHAWGDAAYVLWWVNAGMAIASCVGIPLIFVHSLQAQGGFTKSLTPTTQLPLIAALTSAAAAGTLASSATLSKSQQIPMIIVAYLEIGLALPLALSLDVVFLVRVLLPWGDGSDGPLPSKQVYTDMVLCGPWGQSSYAFQALGLAVLNLQPELGGYPSPEKAAFVAREAAGPIAYASMLAGLIAWGQGTFWWVFALWSIGRSTQKSIRRREPLPFGLPTWAIVFPWGVYTNAALELGKLLNSTAYKVWSTVLALVLVLTWLVCMALTIRGVALGTMLGFSRGWRIKPKRNSAAVGN